MQQINHAKKKLYVVILVFPFVFYFNLYLHCFIFRGASAIVVNVEYRLAPEHKFPAQMDDGVCATKWVLENKQTIGKYQL